MPTRMHKYIHSYMYTFTHIHSYVYLCTYLNVYIHIVYIHTHTCMHTPMTMKANYKSGKSLTDHQDIISCWTEYCTELYNEVANTMDPVTCHHHSQER